MAAPCPGSRSHYIGHVEIGTRDAVVRLICPHCKAVLEAEFAIEDCHIDYDVHRARITRTETATLFIPTHTTEDQP